MTAYFEWITVCTIQEHQIVHNEGVRDLQLAGGWHIIRSSTDSTGVSGVEFVLSAMASKAFSVRFLPWPVYSAACVVPLSDTRAVQSEADHKLLLHLWTSVRPLTVELILSCHSIPRKIVKWTFAMVITPDWTKYFFFSTSLP